MKLRHTLVLLPLFLTGCLIGSTDSQSRSGKYVSESTFNQLKMGETTPSFAEAILGSPDAKTPQEDGTEIWRYSYSETKKSSGYVFLVFGGTSSKESSHSAFLQFKDDRLIKAWRD